MKTIRAVWPGLKARMERFQNVAVSLRNAGELNAVKEVDIEKDVRWITRKLSVLTDELVPFVQLGNREGDTEGLKRFRLGSNCRRF